MAKRGRPPKTSERRAREGGTAKRGSVSHRPKAELVVVAGRNVPVSPPDELPADARTFWIEVVQALADAGIIDRIDLPALRVMSVAYARWTQARRILDEPVTDHELENLAKRIRESETLASALKSRVARTLQADLPVPSKDVNALAKYEETITNLEALRQSMATSGRIIALGSTGQLTEHPMAEAERKAAALLLRYADEFALTPTARTRLGIAVLEGRALKQELDDDLGPPARR